MSHKKKTISQTAATKFAILRIGYGSQEGVSCYTLCAKALAVDGLPCPPGMTEKQWVMQNHAHINAATNSAPYIPKVRKKTKKTAKPSRLRLASFNSRPPVIQLNGVDVCSNDFLQTYEWRVLRMQALKLHGARCQCCGATPSDGSVMNVDHIKPRRIFPALALSLDNLQVLCGPCNHGKGNWDMTDWRGGMDDEALDAEQRSHLRAIA
jgi:5-methylcytosine-specific restriction endonuclease McrA